MKWKKSMCFDSKRNRKGIWYVFFAIITVSKLKKYQFEWQNKSRNTKTSQQWNVNDFHSFILNYRCENCLNYTYLLGGKKKEIISTNTVLSASFDH